MPEKQDWGRFRLLSALREGPERAAARDAPLFQPRPEQPGLAMDEAERALEDGWMLPDEETEAAELAGPGWRELLALRRNRTLHDQHGGAVRLQQQRAALFIQVCSPCTLQV